MRLKAILSKADDLKTLTPNFGEKQVCERVFQRHSVLARTVSFLGITGKFQVEDRVVHLVAQKLWEPKLELKPTAARNRDFH